jgi:dTDP-D-glucose 4,6-dehydratase
MSDSKYIESLIGCKPNTRLEDGIAKTIEWALREDISSKLNNWVKSV